MNLIKSVLEHACIEFEPDGGGPDYFVCSMCQSREQAIYDPPGHINQISLSGITHEEDCPYVIAKALSRGSDEDQRKEIRDFELGKRAGKQEVREAMCDALGLNDIVRTVDLERIG